VRNLKNGPVTRLVYPNLTTAMVILKLQLTFDFI